MGRLTHMSDGYYAVDSADCWEDQNEEYNGPAIDRLAAYEDTGLDPGEIATAQKAMRAALSLACELQSFRNLGEFDHLRELVQAEKDGLLVMLPCKINDWVWFIDCTFVDCNKCEPTYGINCPYICDSICPKGEIRKALFRHDMIPQFGKTVFLTREEAEAALEAQKGG